MRKFAYTTLALVTIGVLVLAGYCLYFNERIALSRAVAKLDHVELIEIDGHDDVTFETHSVHLKVRENGFLRIGSNRFNEPGHVDLWEIGPYHLNMGTYDILISKTVPFIWGSPDVGSADPLASLMPVTLNSVQDLIDNYDAILATVESWYEKGGVEHQPYGSSTLYRVEVKKVR